MSKSANYCFADQNNNTGLLLLCDVEVGETADRLEVYDADNMLHEQFPRNGKLCTHGFGREGPDPAGDRVVKGVTVPCGKMAKTGRTNPTGGFTLQCAFNRKTLFFSFFFFSFSFFPPGSSSPHFETPSLSAWCAHTHILTSRCRRGNWLDCLSCKLGLIALPLSLSL